MTVKFAPENAKDLHALAESRGMEVSEYIRHLVLRDKERARIEWGALDRIFGAKGGADKDYRE